MKYALAAIGSITTAVRLKKAVGAEKSVQIVHTPAVINKGGCSYSLRFSEELIPKIKRIAEKNSITIKNKENSIVISRSSFYFIPINV